MAKKTNKKPQSLRVPVPLSKVEEHLVAQLRFLRNSAAEFDAGDMAEFQRLAVALRILLYHRPPTSHSILEQVGLSGVPFASYSQPIDPNNSLSEFRLAITHVSGNGARLIPMLDQGPFEPRWVDLGDWMSEPVLRDDHLHVFSRVEIIRFVVDQDGGAHVDPKVDEAYHRLANEHSIGLVQVGPDGEAPIEHIEKVYVHHIAWEVLVSIEPAWKKVLGNRPCNCGSGRKERYCCGKKNRSQAE